VRESSGIGILFGLKEGLYPKSTQRNNKFLDISTSNKKKTHNKKRRIGVYRINLA